MASTRLPSIWSAITRHSDLTNPALRSAIAAQRIRAYHPTRRFAQEQVPQQRYGTANEPPPGLREDRAVDQTIRQSSSSETKVKPNVPTQAQQDEVKPPKPSTSASAKTEPTTIDGARTQTSTISAPMTDPMLDSTNPVGRASDRVASGTSNRSSTNPLNSILDSVPEPKDEAVKEPAKTFKDEQHAFDEHSPPVKAPHIEQPRYVHHFDTYGLVTRLKDAKWDEKQAITTMKAMRMILADKSDLAKDALVSKSQLENEAYLFKAACAELRTEVLARRRAEQEKMRTERTQLQHEVDILSQTLTQHTTTLKDELKGLFDDRKMAVRNEQRDMESKIQQLNYRITVELASDGKSEVEGLRWIMTRRVILTLAIVVLMILGGLKGAANIYAAEEAAAKEKAAAAEKAKAGMTSAGTSSSGTQTGEGYESLG